MASTPREVRAERILDLHPGQAIVHLVLKLSMRHGGTVRPRMDEHGAHLPLVPRTLDGRGEVSVTAEGSGSRIVLVGTPPPWPFRWRWADRKLASLFHGHPASGPVAPPSR